MNDANDFLDRIWDGLLSRVPRLIQETFSSLDLSSQYAVLEHLKRMASEEDWHPEQVISAREALRALEEITRKITSSNDPQ